MTHRIRCLGSVLLFAATMLTTVRTADACTSLLVSRGASESAATYLTYVADSHELYGELVVRPGGHFPVGAERPIVEWDTHRVLGAIPAAERRGAASRSASARSASSSAASSTPSRSRTSGM